MYVRKSTSSGDALSSHGACSCQTRGRQTLSKRQIANTANPLLPHNAGDSIHEQVGAFMTLLVPRAPPKTDHIKSSRLRQTTYTNPALQNKSMYEQQKELSQALRQYENRPQPPAMPRGSTAVRFAPQDEFLAVFTVSRSATGTAPAAVWSLVWSPC